MTHFSKIILTWYREYGRKLPWRETTDPYSIWISEIILQQTRVAQGYDYFQRFMARFPDVKTLADATEDEVLKYWQGLGYYSRARNLYAAAKSMNGAFPATYEQVRALKGVGEYTAAAICSFAYGMPYAVVDGNVYRVLARYLGEDIPIDSPAGKKKFQALADQLQDREHPGDYNQAIMDFGAVQCTPQNPNCLFCPLSGNCKALSLGKVNQLPVKQTKTKTSNRYFNYVFICSGDCTFLHKRTENDIWKNLFELPLIETDFPVSSDALQQLRAFEELLSGKEYSGFRQVKANVKHVLSHRIIYADFYMLELPPEAELPQEYERVKGAALEQYAVPKLIADFLLLLRKKRDGVFCNF